MAVDGIVGPITWGSLTKGGSNGGTSGGSGAGTGSGVGTGAGGGGGSSWPSDKSIIYDVPLYKQGNTNLCWHIVKQ